MADAGFHWELMQVQLCVNCQLKKKTFRFIKSFQWKQPMGVYFEPINIIPVLFSSEWLQLAWTWTEKWKSAKKVKYFQKLLWWIHAAPKDTPQSHLQSCYGQPVAVMAARARGGRPVGRARGRAGTGPGPGRPRLLELLDHAQPRGHSWRHHSSVRHLRGFFYNRWRDVKILLPEDSSEETTDEWPTGKLNLKRSYRH